jgi:tetratricopeptide (TPR) repeat protein
MNLIFGWKNFIRRFMVWLVFGIACFTASAVGLSSTERAEWDSLWLKFEQKNVEKPNTSDLGFEIICNDLFEMSKNYDLNTLLDAARFEKLGFLFDTQFQLERALILKQRVLEIYKKTLGPENTQTVRAKNNLAYTYSLLNEPEKALPLLLEVLAIHRKSLGMDSQSAAQVLNNLAVVYGELGQPNEMLP